MAPRSLVERHYVEKIAAAFWILRRLRRWQAGLFADETLTENERLDKLEKALRHETALNRQVDTALKMLNKDVPEFFKGRPREQALPDAGPAEPERGGNCENELVGEQDALERTSQTVPNIVRICENEPAPASRTLPHPFREGQCEATGRVPPPTPPELGAGGLPLPDRRGPPRPRPHRRRPSPTLLGLTALFLCRVPL